MRLKSKIIDASLFFVIHRYLCITLRQPLYRGLCSYIKSVKDYFGAVEY